MEDNESDLHRLGEDVVDHITSIQQAFKKLEGPEGQLGVQFHDTFLKYASFDMKSTFPLMCHYTRRILESMELLIRGRMGRNTFRVTNSSPTDGAKIQEYRKKLTRIMQHLEVISPPNLHVLQRLSHHIFSSALRPVFRIPNSEQQEGE